MAESSTHTVSDERSYNDVRKENFRLIKDIVRYCSQRDYKKHNVLLIGQSGSGKSSIINTLLKVIIGDYFPRAKAGFGDVTSYTLQLKCYKNCGAKDTDFERREERRRQENHSEHGITDNTRSMKNVREKLPDIFDAAGMKDRNDENTKEILRLLIGGHISPNTNIAELMRLQGEHGLGYLPMRYRSSKNEFKMTMVVFACSCTGQIPYDLIKCVREVLQEVDQFTSSNKYDTDIFVLITKYDKVKTVDPKVHTTAVSGDSSVDCSIETTDIANDQEKENDVNESNITLDKFNEVRRKITEAFIQTGTATHSQLYWASYNDFIGYDNVYVDNKALKLLKVLTTPLHTDELPSLVTAADSLNNILVDLLFRLRRVLGQNVLMFLTVIVLLFGLLLWGLSSGDLRRN